MEETKFVFPEGSGGMSPADIMAMTNNGMNGGNWMWMLFLVLLFGRNGYGNYSGIDAGLGSNLIMQAIQGNKDAIGNLSSMLNCDINSIQSALSAIQLSNCQQTNTIQSAINSVNSTVERGFGNSNYEAAARACDIKSTIKDTTLQSTEAILNKLDAIENRALQDKIDALTAQNNTLQTQINLDAQNAAFAHMIEPLKSEISAIKAAQPPTVAVPYPQLTAVPSSYLNGFYGPTPYGGSIWS